MLVINSVNGLASSADLSGVAHPEFPTTTEELLRSTHLCHALSHSYNSWGRLTTLLVDILYNCLISIWEHLKNFLKTTKFSTALLLTHFLHRLLPIDCCLLESQNFQNSGIQMASRHSCSGLKRPSQYQLASHHRHEFCTLLDLWILLRLSDGSIS